jgi:uroporphyrin-3 C-methyltransferase
MNETAPPPAAGAQAAADASPPAEPRSPQGAAAHAPPDLRAAAAPGPGRDPSRVAWLAVGLASVAIVLGGVAVQRSLELISRLDQARGEEQAREARELERERQVEELRREWSQAQSEADVAAGQLTDAELRRRREALALIDIERVVEQAQVQLRLGAPASVALAALAAVDARLDRLAGPAAIRVQVALRHDLARLKAAPDLDRGQLAARLDPLIGSVDSWHASADSTHASQRPQAAPAAAAARGAGAAGGAPASESAGARARAWIEREFGDLLRIRQIDTPEALQIGPVQQQLLRDRVRLGLLDLREAILAHDERTIRAEDAALESLLARYFDPNQPEVAAAIAQLRATSAAATGWVSPSLDETLGALRAARLGAP